MSRSRSHSVTTDHHRMRSMMEALRKLRVPHSPGVPLFFLTTRDELRAADPLTHEWQDWQWPGRPTELGWRGARPRRCLMPRQLQRSKRHDAH